MKEEERLTLKNKYVEPLLAILKHVYPAENNTINHLIHIAIKASGNKGEISQVIVNSITGAYDTATAKCLKTICEIFDPRVNIGHTLLSNETLDSSMVRKTIEQLFHESLISSENLSSEELATRKEARRLFKLGLDESEALTRIKLFNEATNLAPYLANNINVTTEKDYIKYSTAFYELASSNVSKHTEENFNFLTAAIRLDPKNVKAYIKRSSINFQTSSKEAISDLNSALKIIELSNEKRLYLPQIYFMRAALYISQNNYKLAVDDFIKIYDFDMLNLSGDYQKFIKVFNDNRYELIRCYENNKVAMDVMHSIIEFNKKLSNDALSKIYENRADVASVKELKEYSNNIIEFSPTDYLAYYNLGVGYYEHSLVNPSTDHTVIINLLSKAIEYAIKPYAPEINDEINNAYIIKAKLQIHNPEVGFSRIQWLSKIMEDLENVSHMETIFADKTSEYEVLIELYEHLTTEFLNENRLDEAIEYSNSAIWAIELKDDETKTKSTPSLWRNHINLSRAYLKLDDKNQAAKSLANLFLSHDIENFKEFFNSDEIRTNIDLRSTLYAALDLANVNSNYNILYFRAALELDPEQYIPNPVIGYFTANLAVHNDRINQRQNHVTRYDSFKEGLTHLDTTYGKFTTEVLEEQRAKKYDIAPSLFNNGTRALG